MEVRTLLLADYYDADPTTGKFYVGGGFTQVVADEYPAKLGPESKLILVIEAEYGEPQPEIRIDFRIRGDDEPMASNPFSFTKAPDDVPEGTPSHHALRIGLRDVVLPIPEQYFFDVFFDGTLKSTLRFIALRSPQKSQEEMQ